MPRPPKNNMKQPVDSAVAPAPVINQRPIDVEGFVRVRDSVYSRLMTIQNLIHSFSVDYLRQTNLLLGLGTADNLENVLDFPNLDGLGNLLPVGGLVPVPAEEPKKERKKRQHDPNAPKRPLTPYFLYMQTARPIIAHDLGSDAAKGAVQEEGQRRWGTMSQAEKAGWDQAYQYNLRLYNARVHSYKHGNPDAKEMSDEEAQQYAEAHNIPMPTGKDVAAAGGVGHDAGNDHDAAAIAQQLQGTVVEPEVEDEEEEEEEEVPEPESPPVIKTPKSTGKKGGAAGKRKSAAAVEPPTPAPQESSTKKRKRQSKVTEEKPEPEPKKSGRNKKTKSG